MRYLYLIISILVVATTSSFSQDKAKSDSIGKSKMNEYKEMIKKADKFEAKSEMALQKTNQYKADARRFLDSAYVIAKKGESDKANAKLYAIQMNYFFDASSSLANKADSSLKIAQLNKDSSNILNKKAEAFYFDISEEYKPAQGDTAKPIVYVIQLGAGDENNKYFEKLEGIETITPSDGIKRYIIGKFTSKEAAMDYRQKLIDKGFTDAFIRTQDSLKY